MIAQSRAENRINLKIAIKKNRSEPDSNFRQSKDGSGSSLFEEELVRNGIRKASGGLNRAGLRVPEKRAYLDVAAFFFALTLLKMDTSRNSAAAVPVPT